LHGTILFKLGGDEPISNFAFTFNLRRYTTASTLGTMPERFTDKLDAFLSNAHPGYFAGDVEAGGKKKKGKSKVGRCRWPVSNPELKARLVSALET
jgi:hypothetical protein